MKASLFSNLSLRGLVNFIERADTWFNLNPTGFEEGDYLMIERNGYPTRVASLAPKDVVVVFRGANNDHPAD